MHRYIDLILTILAILVCLSCKQKSTEDSLFDEKIALLENNPKLYQSKLDTSKLSEITNEEEATNFLLVSLAQNYINQNCYPQKTALLKSISFFINKNKTQQQLEALFLLAGMYKKDKDLNNEVKTIEDAITIAKQENDEIWLFHLYSYLGDMYVRKYNKPKSIQYQTLANQFIKHIEFKDMSIPTQIQVAKSLLYIGQYKKAYELLKTLDNSINKNGIYYNESKRLQGIALFKLKEWKLSIEKLQEALKQEYLSENKFICHSILTYCYYLIGDIHSARLHEKRALEYRSENGINYTEIEFYKNCAEFAKENNNPEAQTECLISTVEQYEGALNTLNEQSLDEVIQAYKHVYEKRLYEKRIAIYKYCLAGLLIILGIWGIIYINRKKKRAYQLLALQQQIQALENLESIKNEVKSFILRDFEIAKQIAMLRYTQKEQSAKFVKDLDKYSLIKNNDLLTTQWDKFYEHINLSFKNFYSLLKEKYSCLNEKELQLCCMLIAEFKTEEIAAIWMQSVFSVHKHKTNIRKKIQAPEGANIIIFLSNKLDLQ